MKHYTLIETAIEAKTKNDAVEKSEIALKNNKDVEYEASVVLNADTTHKAYLQYLSRWIFEHYGDEFKGCSPAGFDEWLDNEGESYCEDNLINGMEPERYLASLLLANSSYKGEKYYEKEDEYTEIIKENKHLLSNNNEDGPIDEEKALIWKVSYGEYIFEENGDIVLDNTAASVFNVGNLVKVVSEDEDDSFGIYRGVKVTNTYCVCEFIK